MTVAAASRNHHIVILKAETPTTEYREQDSKGFYSFGYSGDESAKAEYKTQDGSSKGFYSYIDTDGKLQTVKYEAGRKQGFTASATNLPVQPVDNSQAPEPVTDTPEVEIAKQAHFEAYRDAAIKAAMEPDNDGTDNEDMGEEAAKEGLSAEEMAGLQQDARNLLLSRQNSRDQLLALLREHDMEQNSREQAQQGHSQMMTTYILSAQADARTHGSGQARALAHARIGQSAGNSELRTVYRMDNGDSNVELKVGTDNGNGNSKIGDISTLQALHVLQHEPIAVHSAENSYYTVDNPSTHYTVEIPTVLTTLPRIESLRLGGNGHIVSPAKSTTYITQRLKSSTF